MKTFFKIEEFFVTDTGLMNVPHKNAELYVYNNIERLIKVLDVIRALLQVPIKVTSGYRTKEVNEKVGGVKNSRHLYGCAADITATRFVTLFEICKKLHEQGIFCECIIYPEKHIIHVSI